MAGPFPPFSAIPITSGSVWPEPYDGAEAMMVEASVGADSTWRLAFDVPTVLPSGTAKLRLSARANAATGVAKVNPQWVSVAVEEDFGGASVNAEGTQTVTWGTGDEDQIKEAKVDLDADTVVAGERIKMDLVFETTDWTLAVKSAWDAAIIWE